MPRGGPNGGDGGRGGSIVLRADPNVATLLDFRYRKYTRAAKGKPGEGNNRTGAGGKDEIIKVPCGTLVYDDDNRLSNHSSRSRSAAKRSSLSTHR